MKTKLLLLFVLCGHAVAESSHADKEAPLVKRGVLGTVNVLRELDPRTFTNRVRATANVPGKKSTPQDTIDSSGAASHPQVEKSAPLVLTYSLPEKLHELATLAAHHPTPTR